MNKHAKKWVKALRSGKYEQGKFSLCVWDIKHKDSDDALNNKNPVLGKFCCLGVAAWLMDDVKIEVRRGTDRLQFNLDDNEYVFLTKGMMELYNLTFHSGHFSKDWLKEKKPELYQKIMDKLEESVKDLRYISEFSLSYLNDSGCPFSLIADVIEAEPAGLFKPK